mmetsp:Transcript_26366/g.30167  ORF Transcript_26366/g.30167 Transcript_26366/m.30167 type:complete len:81 (-) Transcript_26366:996-1238(-)
MFDAYLVETQTSTLQSAEVCFGFSKRMTLWFLADTGYIFSKAVKLWFFLGVFAMKQKHQCQKFDPSFRMKYKVELKTPNA